MSTSLQSFFDAMKSEETSNESLDIDVGELLSYCIESKSKELNEIGKFIERIDASLESLKSKEEVTNEDIASFESQVNELLEFNGAANLQHLFIPSFESGNVAVYATEAEEKAEAVKKPLTEKMMDGIRYLIKKLKQFGLWLKKHLYDRWKKKEETVQEHLDKQAAKAKAATSGKAEGRVVEPSDKMTLIVPRALTKNGKLFLDNVSTSHNKFFKDSYDELSKALANKSTNKSWEVHDTLVVIDKKIFAAKWKVEKLSEIDPRDVVHIEYTEGLITKLSNELKEIIKHHNTIKDRITKDVEEYVKIAERVINEQDKESRFNDEVRKDIVYVHGSLKKLTDALDVHINKISACMVQVRVSSGVQSE